MEEIATVNTRAEIQSLVTEVNHIFKVTYNNMSIGNRPFMDKYNYAYKT